MAELLLDIAGLPTAIVSRDPRVIRLAEDRYAGFLADGEPAWRITVDDRPCPLQPGEDVVVARDGRERLDIRRYDFQATLDLGSRRGDVAFAELDEYALDSFLRVLYSLTLIAAGGLLVHAANVGRDGRAYVFPGPSGSGKTTVTRLSPESTLLSDEIAAVRTGPQGGIAYGTPFWGELAKAGANEALPVAGIYFLHQAQAHAARGLRRPEAILGVLSNVLFFARDPALTARLLDVAAELVASVPCFRLDFRRDPGFWEVITHD